MKVPLARTSRVLAKTLVLATLMPLSLAATTTEVCADATSLGKFTFHVERQGNKLPLTAVNSLEAGDSLSYPDAGRSGLSAAGIDLLGLLVVHRRADMRHELEVLHPGPPNDEPVDPLRWTMPFKVDLVLALFGPTDSNFRPIKNLYDDASRLRKNITDQIEFISAYADRIEKIGTLAGVLAEWKQSPLSKRFDIILDNLSLRYGVSLPLGDPDDSELLNVSRVLNNVMVWQPNGSENDLPSNQTTTKTVTGVASNLVTFFLGEWASIIQVSARIAKRFRSLFIRDSVLDLDFAFVPQSPLNPSTNLSTAMDLCSQRRTLSDREKLVYVWALRIPSVDQPSNVELAVDEILPIGQEVSLDIAATNHSELTALHRAHSWKLLPCDGEQRRASSVSDDELDEGLNVQIDPPNKTLLLDLRAPKGVLVTSGDSAKYKLEAKWDNQRLSVDGCFRLAMPATTIYAEQSTTREGSTALTLSTDEESSLQFVERIEIEDLQSFPRKKIDLAFRRNLEGVNDPITQLEVDVDILGIDSRVYTLRVYQQGQDDPITSELEVIQSVQNLEAVVELDKVAGKRTSFLRVQNAPIERITQIRLCDNAGSETVCRVVHESKLDTENADGCTEWQLGDGWERLYEGQKLDLQFDTTLFRFRKMKENSAPEEVSHTVELSDAVTVIERPRIVKASPLMSENGPGIVQIGLGEVPGGSSVGFDLDIEDTRSPGALEVLCFDYGRAACVSRATEEIGANGLRSTCSVDSGRRVLVSSAPSSEAEQQIVFEKTPRDSAHNLTRLSGFFSIDPIRVGPSQCCLGLQVTSDDGHISDPYVIGWLLGVLPKIQSVELSSIEASDQCEAGECLESTENEVENCDTSSRLYEGVLRGKNLHRIRKVGWTAGQGFEVNRTLASEQDVAEGQNIRIKLPWPCPGPQPGLFVWLNGDDDGRSRLTEVGSIKIHLGGEP